MKSRWIRFAAFVCLGGLVFSVRLPSQAQAQAVVECAIPFEASVRSGPNAGLSVSGELQLVAQASGSTTGALALADGSRIPLVGQVNGRAINLLFALDISAEVEAPRVIFGTGTALTPIDAETCGTWLGGPFSGPDAGDSGDWVAGNRAGLVGGDRDFFAVTTDPEPEVAVDAPAGEGREDLAGLDKDYDEVGTESSSDAPGDEAAGDE